MLRMFERAVSLTLALIFLLAGWGAAAEMTGQIQSISNRAKTLQIQDAKSKQVMVVRLDEKTQFVNAKSLKDFIVNDKVVVKFEPGQPANQVKRVVIQIPAEKQVTTKELVDLYARGTAMTIVDARPTPRFKEGHLPGALSIPVSELSKRFGELPADKNRLLIFYCGGPT